MPMGFPSPKIAAIVLESMVDQWVSGLGKTNNVCVVDYDKQIIVYICCFITKVLKFN